MKKSLIPVAFSLLCILAVVACQRSANTPAPTLQSKLIGKWTLVTALFNTTNYGVNQKDTLRFTSADYFEFKADSTISIMVAGVAYNGRWKIDNSQVYISGTNYIDSSDGWQLPILDPHNLQMYFTQTLPDNFTEEKMNFTR